MRDPTFVDHSSGDTPQFPSLVVIKRRDLAKLTSSTERKPRIRSKTSIPNASFDDQVRRAGALEAVNSTVVGDERWTVSRGDIGMSDCASSRNYS